MGGNEPEHLHDEISLNLTRTLDATAGVMDEAAGLALAITLYSAAVGCQTISATFTWRGITPRIKYRPRAAATTMAGLSSVVGKLGLRPMKRLTTLHQPAESGQQLHGLLARALHQLVGTLVDSSNKALMSWGWCSTRPREAR